MMNLTHLRRPLSVLMVMTLTACPSRTTYLAQPQLIEAQGAYRHAASGMRFPDHVDNFRRVALMRYDKDTLDVSAGFNSTDPSVPIIATVYVYPAPSLVSIGSPGDIVASAREHLCRDEFARRKAEIVSAHPDAKLIVEQDISLPRNREQFPGKKAIYDFVDLFGGARLRLSSELYVFCYVDGKWSFEYRFTSPYGVAASPPIAAFMADLPWTTSNTR